VIVLNQALYYITPGDLLQAMIDAKAVASFASLHEFPDQVGQYHKGQLKYTRMPGGTVRCDLLGNRQRYEHSDMSWLTMTNSFCGYDDHGEDVVHVARDVKLVWELQTTCGCVSVYKFVVCPIDTEEVVMAPLEGDFNAAEEDAAVQDIASSAVPFVLGSSIDSSTLAVLGRLVRSRLSDVKDKARVSARAIEEAYAMVVRHSAQLATTVHDFAVPVWQVNRLIRDASVPPSFIEGVRDQVGVLEGHIISGIGNAATTATHLCRDILREAYKAVRALPKMAWLPRLMHDADMEWAGFIVETALSTTSIGCGANAVLEFISGNRWLSLMHMAPIVLPWWAFAALHLIWNLSRQVVLHPEPFEDVCLEGVELKPMDESSSIHVLSSECVPKVGCVLAAFSTEVSVVVPRPCGHNAEIGLRNRVLFARDPVDPVYWQDPVLAEWLPRTPAVVDYMEWLQHLTPMKRRMVQQGLGNEIVRGVIDVDTFKNTRVISIVKQEKLVKALKMNGVMDVADFKPRMISARSPAYQRHFGPACYAIGEQMKFSWGRQTPVTYSSGMSSTALGAWMASAEALEDVVFLEGDFTCFDGTIGVEALKFQYSVMRRKFDTDCDYELDLSTNGLYSKGGSHITYVTRGTRKSGNNDTSVGNSILNACFIMGAWAHCGEVANPDRMRAIVLGDDSLIAVNQACAARLMEMLQADAVRAGFKIKIDEWKLAAQASFCSQRFFAYSVELYRAAWKPGIMLAKAGFWCRPDMHWQGHVARWVTALAICLAHSYYHVPILRCLALHLCQLFVDETITDVDDMVGMLRVRNIVEQLEIMGDHDTRWVNTADCDYPAVDESQAVAQFSLIYGLSSDAIADCEAWVMKLPRSLPWTLNHAAIRRIVQVDVGEIAGLDSARDVPDA